MLTKYIQALGLDGRDPRAEPELARDLGAIDLPPLVLPPRRRRRSWEALAAALAACAILGALAWRQLLPADADLTVKGDAHVTIFAEQNGTVKELKPGMRLGNGDRALAEVLASERTLAYWGTFDREGMNLESWGIVRESAMELRPGERKTFPSSLKLEGKNEGETVVVVTCPAASPLPPSLETGALAANFQRFLADAANATVLVGACKAWKFSLR